MSSQWINRIFEVDPAFVSSRESRRFASTSEAMKARFLQDRPEAGESLDPMAVLRMGIDEYLATGSADVGLFRRLKDSIDERIGERTQHAQSGVSG